MPYKHNEKRRHKIGKARYKVTNWQDYNNGIRQRGDFTFWIDEEVTIGWRPTKTGASIMKAGIAIPDFSSISKQCITIPKYILIKAKQPVSIVIVDSTGLKVYGKDEWHQEKHAVPAQRTWRKLHLFIDENHNVLACELITREACAPAAIPDLLGQIDTLFDTFLGDGAYDGEPVAQAVLNKQPNTHEVVPQHISIAGETQRDQHIQLIAQLGRIAWQRKTGYNLRSHVEFATQRYKRIFGNTMKARELPQQRTEAWTNMSALNRMSSSVACVCKHPTQARNGELRANFDLFNNTHRMHFSEDALI